MSRTWSTFLNRPLLDYVLSQQFMLRKIMNFVPNGGKILEVGFGSGWSCILLANKGYEVWGLDKDEANYRKADATAGKLGVQTCFMLGDLFDLGEYPRTFDLGFSEAVFEHFDDEQVVLGLQRMKAMCKLVVMDIPSYHARNDPVQYGDEIYRTTREWKRLIREAGFKIKDMYGVVHRSPLWIRFLTPPLLARWLAKHFSKRVGFIL